MSDSDFGTRADAATNKFLEAGHERLKLDQDLGVAMAERLLKLFANRDEKSQNSWSFEDWLNAQFNNDTYSFYDIFEKDEELKKLLGYVFYRTAVSIAMNDVLRTHGYRRGINRTLTNIDRI